MIPVSCSLCAWTSEAANADEACRLGDLHLDQAHSLSPETGWTQSSWHTDKGMRIEPPKTIDPNEKIEWITTFLEVKTDA